MNPTDPDARAAFITGLYQLADYLAENAGIPVPEYGTTILVPLGEQDDGTRAEIDYVVAEYLWPVRDEDGCYETHRDFGPVGYTIYSLTKAFKDRYSRQDPCRGSIHPGRGDQRCLTPSAIPQPTGCWMNMTPPTTRSGSPGLYAGSPPCSGGAYSSSRCSPSATR